MPSITYRGSFDVNTAGANGLDVQVENGTALPAHATITDISFTLDISAERYSSSHNWRLLWFAIGSADGSPYASEQTKKMSNDEYTFSGKMNFSQSDVEKFSTGSFDVYAKANTSFDTRSYMGDFTITVEYIEHTDCGAPTACAVDRTHSPVDVTLSWSGATAGTTNAIKAYEIEYRDSSDGEAWGEWATLKTVSSTETSGSALVPPPIAGYYRQFRIRTQGEAGSDYYSEWKESTNTLRGGHDALEGFTDDPLTAGAYVKALHMTELQDRVNTLRAFYGLSAYAFSLIDTHGIAGWTAHVNELRAAIDEIGVEHETWLEIPVNCPRADVMNQLRAVVMAL